MWKNEVSAASPGTRGKHASGREGAISCRRPAFKVAPAPNGGLRDVETRPGGGPLGAAAALIVSIAACDGGTDRTVIAPTAPPTSSPPAPPPAGTVTGMVLEFTTTGERRPVPNLRLQVRTGGPADGAVGGVELPDVVTDRNGRYEIAGVTSPLLFFTTAPGSDYRFLCDFYPLVTRLPAVPRFHDLPVVHVSWSGDRLPAGMWSLGTSVDGTVSERVNETLRPVAGATVTLDGGTQDPPAVTSATGFYMVCSVVGTDHDPHDHRSQGWLPHGSPPDLGRVGFPRRSRTCSRLTVTNIRSRRY